MENKSNHTNKAIHYFEQQPKYKHTNCLSSKGGEGQLHVALRQYFQHGRDMRLQHVAVTRNGLHAMQLHRHVVLVDVR